MANMDFVDADYCQYSDWGYQKPTRFWGSADVAHKKLKLCDFRHNRKCPNVDPETGRHRVQLSSKHCNLPRILKYRIPPDLVRALATPEEPGQGLKYKGASLAGRQVQIFPSSIPTTVGKIQCEGKARQLLLWVSIRPPGGNPRVAQVLIDTGAEANLIRRDFFGASSTLVVTTPPSSCLRRRHPYGGGKREVALEICFQTIASPQGGVGHGVPKPRSMRQTSG